LTSLKQTDIIPKELSSHHYPQIFPG